MAVVLRRVQRGLEELYRVETGADVADFVVDRDVRDACVGDGRRPREQLLVSEDGDAMSLALFVDPAAISNLARRDPARQLTDANFGDFLLAIEGVSHFIYAICCARAERPVSQLELELQAEVDKYVTCLLVTEPTPEVSRALRARLFDACAYDDDLDGDEQARYRAANDNARRYTGLLEDAFVTARRIPEMLAELRRFYRRGLAAKLAACAMTM